MDDDKTHNNQHQDRPSPSSSHDTASSRSLAVLGSIVNTHCDLRSRRYSISLCGIDHGTVVGKHDSTCQQRQVLLQIIQSKHATASGLAFQVFKNPHTWPLSEQVTMFMAGGEVSSTNAAHSAGTIITILMHISTQCLLWISLIPAVHCFMIDIWHTKCFIIIIISDKFFKLQP